MRKQANADQQKLSKDQEDHIIVWATVETKLGLPPTHLQIHQAAQRILQASGSKELLGRNWITNFMRQNPSIKSLKGKHIEKERIKAVTPDKIKEFFKVLNETPVKDIQLVN